MGGNQHIAFPLTMVNAAIADSLKHMCDEVDAGKPVDQVIRETIQENQGALFSGDGYSDALYEHAEKHGLIHLRSSPEAYEALTADKNVKLMGELGILNEHELVARQSVLQEAYATELHIEARALLRILRTQILPVSMEDTRADRDSGFQSPMFDKKRELVEELLSETENLADAYDAFPHDDPGEAASYAHESLKPRMQSARDVADRLELLVDGRAWPFPTYSEVLHHHQ